MLSVKAHTEMLAEQFLAGSYLSHCADLKTTCLTGFCPMKPTLISMGTARNNTNNKEQLNRKNELKSTHRVTVPTQLIKDNKPLRTPPPKIAEVQTLPRIALILWAQLKTGYCPQLLPE